MQKAQFINFARSLYLCMSAIAPTSCAAVSLLQTQLYRFGVMGWQFHFHSFVGILLDNIISGCVLTLLEQ